MQAQSGIAVIVEPSYNFVFIGETTDNVSDSIFNLKVNDRVLSFGLEYRYQIDRDQAITFKPSYNQTNLLLVQSGLQLFDVIHPSLPELKDLTQAATKTAYLHHRFKYIGLQVMYSGRVKTNYKSTGPRFDYNVGLTYNHLINQDIKLRTEGFALQGEFKHIIKDTILFNAKNSNVTLNVGADVSYPLNSSFGLIGGVILNLPVITTTSNDPLLRIFNPAARLGIRYYLN